MKRLHFCLIILLVLPACRLVAPDKAEKVDKTRAALKAAKNPKPRPNVVLIPPELVGQECVVVERFDEDESAEEKHISCTYTGKLVKFNDNVLELETPLVESQVTREKRILFVPHKSSVVGREHMKENKTLPRPKIESIRAVATGPSEESE